MKASIITYVYVTPSNGRLPMLKRALDSVRAQNFPSYEHLIVDDGSTVDLETFIRERRDENIRYIYKPNTGITLSTETFNRGFLEAKGDYLIILSSDDAQCPGSLQQLSAFLDERPHFVAAVGAARYIDAASSKVRRFFPEWTDAAAELLSRGNFINGCAIMFRKSLFDRGMALPPNIVSFCADYDLWVRVSEFGPIGRVDHTVVDYYNHSDATRNKTRNKGSKRSSALVASERYPFSKAARLRYVVRSAECRRLGTERFIGRDAVVINHLFGSERHEQISNSLRRRIARVFSCGTPDLNTEIGIQNFTKIADYDGDISRVDALSELDEHYRNAIRSAGQIVCVGCRANAAWFTRTLPLNIKVSLIYQNDDLTLRWVHHIDWARVDRIFFCTEEDKLTLERCLGLEPSVGLELLPDDI